MFKHRSIQGLVGLGIILLALLTLGAVITTQRVTSTAGDYRLAPLNWYLTHDHAALDGNDQVISRADGVVYRRWQPLDWYFVHAHAMLDGDNSVNPVATNVSNSQLAPLAWYFAHDHAILDGDNNIVLQ